MDPSILFKMKKAKNQFVENHPKFPLFLKKVGKTALMEGSLIDITVTTPTGETVSSNVKLQASDMELIQLLKGLLKE